jgi:hypothetical protein
MIEITAATPDDLDAMFRRDEEAFGGSVKISGRPGVAFWTSNASVWPGTVVPSPASLDRTRWS